MMRKSEIFWLVWFLWVVFGLVLLAKQVLAQPAQMAAGPQVCLSQSQAQALVAFLALAPALQAQIIEAAQAKDHEAEIIRKAKAEQKAEDDAMKGKAP